MKHVFFLFNDNTVALWLILISVVCKSHCDVDGAYVCFLVLIDSYLDGRRWL
jgi:hypothetical protein